MIHTVTIEQAKRLQSAGFPQGDAQFYWCHSVEDDGTEEWDIEPRSQCCLIVDGEEVVHPDEDTIAAPTADELLELLPRAITIQETYGIVHLERKVFTHQHPSRGILWSIQYASEGDEQFQSNESSLVDAAAAMWIMLKERPPLPTPNTLREMHGLPPVKGPKPPTLTIIELYEHLTAKGYLQRVGSNIDDAYHALKTATGSPESVWTQQQAAIAIMRQGLFMDYPEVFRQYYSGKRYRETRVSWDRMLLNALQRWLDGDRLNPIDFLLQNP